jgi:hypothetical protein
VDRVTGFVLVGQEVSGYIPSLGPSIRLLIRFELLPHPVEFQLELMSSYLAGKENSTGFLILMPIGVSSSILKR